MPSPRLYDDLAWVWNYLSPPSHYAEEVESFRLRFAREGVSSQGSVLHLGSGGGSIDFHLKREYRVTGVDRSAAMIEVARAHNPEVEYVQGDLRDVRLGRTFDGVLLHDASTYMHTPEEMQAAFHTAAAHLEPNGVLIYLPEELRSRFVQHKTKVRTIGDADLSVTTLEVDFDPDPSDRTFETTFVFLIRREGELTVEHDTHTMGLWEIDELLPMLREAGFDAEIEPWELSDLEPGEAYPLITAVLVHPRFAGS
ncbi:MAG: class I SAM-dependent methyltransferase [Fimbriimonadaceae bacterium]|nr:class I SAM-dependent methyltransferase [Fimbriimonadaceae bacterium]